MRHVPQLDGIRGLAVASVVVCHYNILLSIGLGKYYPVIAVQRVLAGGWLGVDIFFVLSGFLITGIILKERTRTDFWGSFYLRRGLRILPAFAVVFVATLLIGHYFFPNLPIHASYIWFATFFMANWTIVTDTEMPMLSHLWSLAVEEQFYFLWPQAAKRISVHKVFRLALILAVASMLLRLGMAMAGVNPYIVYKVTPTRIDGLAIGAALACGITIPAVREFLRAHWRRIGIVAAVLVVCSFLALKGSLFVFSNWSQVLSIPALTVATAMMIFGSIEGALPGILATAFANPVMGWLGRRSYGLYLIHVPIQVGMENSMHTGFLSRLGHSVPINLALSLAGIAVSLLLTEVSWRLIENPAQKLRHRLSNRPAPLKPVIVENAMHSEAAVQIES